MGRNNTTNPDIYTYTNQFHDSGQKQIALKLVVTTWVKPTDKNGVKQGRTPWSQ